MGTAACQSQGLLTSQWEVLETIPGAAWVMDAQGRTVFANRRLLDMTGYSAAELMGRSLFEFLEEATRVDAEQSLARPTGCGVTRHEWSLRRKDGSLLRMLMDCGPLADPHDGEPGTLGIVTDITERQRKEEEWARTESRLHQAQRLLALSGMAGDIARDLQGVLATVTDCTEKAIASLEATDPGTSHLLEIRRATQRAQDLMQRLFAFSRWQEPQRRILAPASVIEEAAQLLRRCLPANVQLRTRLAPTPKVFADPTHVHQVILNLGAYAARIIQAVGGIIELRLDRVSILSGQPRTAATEDLPEGEYVRVSLSNDGRGMDPAAINDLFKPVFRSNSGHPVPETDLSLVQNIVRNHDGVLKVESRPQQGTTFRIYLQAVSDSDTSRRSRASAKEASRAQGEHVMCVDDDEVIVYVTTRALERLGYRASGFLDATEALEAFRSQPNEFSAVLTDLNMPGMTGPELVLEIREIRPDMPLLLTSGSIRPEDVEIAGKLGLSDLIPKPCSIEELARVLGRLLAK